MDLDTLGVINFKYFTLSNYNLTHQLLFINLFAALIGFILFLTINFYLVITDNSIENKIEEIKNDLQSTTIFLENNSIVRIPLFKSCRINNLIDQSCSNHNQNNQIKLSELELEPTSAQQYIIQNFLETDVNIRIYNNNMIEIINSSTLFVGNNSTSDIKVIEISESQEINTDSIGYYLNQYLYLFNKLYFKIVREKYTNDIVKKKHDIKIFKETNKKRRLISHKYIDQENNIVHLSSAPIINNNRVFGVIISSFIIEEDNYDLGLTSFTLFNFYILSILVTILLSLLYIRGLIVTLKKLSKITLLERQKIRTQSKLTYPNRKDEVGILSNEIQKMTNDLKLQINQLEKFTTDVAHELKNPLTAIKSSSELLLKQSLSEHNKNIILSNFNKEVDRMNRLISDISNFSKTISEIESERFELVDLNHFLNKLKNNYLGNSKNVDIIIKSEDSNFNVLLNEDKLLQVMINLIENSLSLVSHRSSILINLQKIDQNFVELKIYDQGNGINFKDKDKIFNRFYTDRDEFRSNHSGLGLSISKEIIKSFEGTIELTKSDNLDFRGACFMIKLPLQPVQ